MRALVLFCSLACASAASISAGYGTPLAPVVVRVSAAPATVPTVHAALPQQPLLLQTPVVQQVVPHQPLVLASPLPAQPLVAPAFLPVPNPSSQFHAQDEFGQFSFGYENENSAKVESRDAFGVTRGSYQYVDANGVLQTVNYVADDVNGFRVAATNIPVAVSGEPVAPAALVAEPLVPVVDTPEVAAAKAEHLAALEAAAAAAEEPARKKREAEPIEAEYGIPLAPVVTEVATPVIVPSVVRTAPLVQRVPLPAPFIPAPAPVVPQQPLVLASALSPQPLTVAAAPAILPVPNPSSQFHAQDEFGQFSFGYENANSAKVESRDAFGVTRGSYQYVDANGVLQTVNYVADDVNGFRVAATNIPVAVSGEPVAPAALVAEPLVPVVDTPEVAAAKAEHLAAVEAAKAAAA